MERGKVSTPGRDAHPMLRAAPLLVALLVASGTAAAGGEETLTCSGLSPFGNFCFDGPKWLRTNSPAASVDALGFVGHLEVRLVDLIFGGDLTWECDAYGNNLVLTSCTGPVRHGNIFKNSLVALVCEAHALHPAGVPVGLGPDGVFACAVIVDFEAS